MTKAITVLVCDVVIRSHRSGVLIPKPRIADNGEVRLASDQASSRPIGLLSSCARLAPTLLCIFVELVKREFRAFDVLDQSVTVLLTIAAVSSCCTFAPLAFFCSFVAICLQYRCASGLLLLVFAY